MEAERPCPICSSSGRAQGRGFTTPCHHCAATRVATLEAELALARKALAAAGELRGWQTTAPPSVVEAFDAAMAEVRKEEG